MLQLPGLEPAVSVSGGESGNDGNSLFYQSHSFGLGLVNRIELNWTKLMILNESINRLSDSLVCFIVPSVNGCCDSLTQGPLHTKVLSQF